VEQLLQEQKEAERQKEQSRRGKIIKESIYPLLVETTESVEDAKGFLQTAQLAVEQAFMNLKMKTLVTDLGIEEHMKNAPEAERYKKLFGAINMENVNVASDLLVSMGNIITNNERQRSKETKLSDLPIKFITYGDTGNS